MCGINPRGKISVCDECLAKEMKHEADRVEANLNKIPVSVTKRPEKKGVKHLKI